jgi:hypothetical protein
MLVLDLLLFIVFVLPHTQVGHVSDSIGDGVVFQLELRDRNYVLRTSTLGEAEKWMYRLRKLRDEAQASSIPEETSLDISTRSAAAVVDKKPTDDDKDKGVTGEWSKVEIDGHKEKKQCCVVS